MDACATTKPAATGLLMSETIGDMFIFERLWWPSNITGYLQRLSDISELIYAGAVYIIKSYLYLTY
jgi:hypothetical protein